MEFVEVREGGDVVGLQPQGFLVAAGRFAVFTVEVENGPQVRVAASVLQKKWPV